MAATFANCSLDEAGSIYRCKADKISPGPPFLAAPGMFGRQFFDHPVSVSPNCETLAEPLAHRRKRESKQEGEVKTGEAQAGRYKYDCHRATSYLLSIHSPITHMSTPISISPTQTIQATVRFQ